MSDEINHNRRRFLGATAMTIAAARFGLIGSADAQSDKTNPAKAPTMFLVKILEPVRRAIGAALQLAFSFG